MVLLPPAHLARSGGGGIYGRGGFDFSTRTFGTECLCLEVCVCVLFVHAATQLQMRGLCCAVFCFLLSLCNCSRPLLLRWCHFCVCLTLWRPVAP